MQAVETRKQKGWIARKGARAIRAMKTEPEHALRSWRRVWSKPSPHGRPTSPTQARFPATRLMQIAEALLAVTRAPLRARPSTETEGVRLWKSTVATNV